MRYQLTYAALLAVAAANEPSTLTPTAPTTTPGVTCAPGLVEGVTGCVLPPTPPPKPLFPWPFKDKCLEKCVNLGSWTDAHGLCAPGAYVSLYQCRDKNCPHDKKDFPEEYHEICSAKTTTTTPEPTPTCTINYRGYCNCPPGWIKDKNMGCVRPTSSSSSTTPEPTPTCTINYRGHCICPPGWVRDSTGACVKPTSSSSSSTTPTPTTTPPYPCGTKCPTHPPHPTLVTITTTTTSIETLTYCPHKHTCHGQTTTWTKTEGPTSCPPTVTCTCVLPGYPTLTSCPRSVTCTGQTTTITEGSTVVLPIETLPPHTPAGPTTSTVVEFPGAAATRGVGLLAVVAGVVAVL